MNKYLIVTENLPYQICGYCEDFNITQKTYWYAGRYQLTFKDIQDDFNQPIKLVPITPELNDMLMTNLTS